MRKKNFLLTILTLACISCTKKTPLQQLIHDADVVKVLVYSGSIKVLHYESNNVDKIQEWKNFIKEDTARSNPGCIQEGKIIFRTSEDSTEMNFSMKKGCTCVSYHLNGINYVQPLTDRGVQYIDSLMKVQ